MSRGSKPSKRSHGKHSAARLAAVQALYQIEMSGADPEDVTVEFVQHRLGGSARDATLPEADQGLFAELVQGACARQAEVDTRISHALANGWTLGRLELLLRVVLRAGAFELMGRPDVPARVVIDEYVEVAHAFFERGEPGLVNGVLDSLAREIRPAEFAAPGLAP